MTTIFGIPAVSVANPDGTEAPYVCRPVPAKPPAWRSWEVVKDDGTVYTVSEYPSGRFACTCPHWKFRGRFKCLPGGACDDKHITAVRESLKPHTEATTHAAVASPTSD